MENYLKQTEDLAKANSLEFKNCGNGHVQISGHGTLVNYWPNSKRRTAFFNGQTIKDCNPWDAVRLCLTKDKQAIKPKKVSKKPPQVPLKPQASRSVVRHLYDGAIPPWEFPTFIAAHSDLLRIEAQQLIDQATVEDAINQLDSQTCWRNL